MTPRFDRWNPLTPLAASLLLVTVAFVAPAPWAPGIALAIALGAAWWAGVGRRAGVMTLSIAIPTPRAMRSRCRCGSARRSPR